MLHPCIQLFTITLLLCLSLIVSADDFDTFESEELQCIIGNNARMEDHRSGYNGVFQLISIHQDKNIFVPAYAGLNLEHIFHPHINLEERTEFFEPRNAPMTFTKLDDRTAQLYQPPTPITHVKSTTTFRLVDPYYIDMEFRCTPTKDVFQDGTFGVFWASYINGAMDKSIYFLHGNSRENAVWQQFCTQMHNRDSTVRAWNDTFRFRFPDSFLDETLFTSFSSIQYYQPFYYGRFQNMVLIYMFDTDQILRLAHSPSGGGGTEDGSDTNPAWDFQLIVPKVTVDQEYTMRMRTVYKQWIDRADVLKEYEQFASTGN